METRQVAGKDIPVWPGTQFFSLAVSSGLYLEYFM